MKKLNLIGGSVGGGGGGGSAPRTPVTAPDSVRSEAFFEVIEAWGKGEIAGFPGADPLEYVFLDGTPIKSNGVVNFPGVAFDYRVGTQAQSYIPGTLDDAVAVTVADSAGKYMARKALSEKEIVKAAAVILNKTVARGQSLNNPDSVKLYFKTQLRELKHEVFICIFFR